MKATLWTKESVCGATGGAGGGDWSATGVSIDSRTIESGDLFIALKGPHTDGHGYVSQAIANGAAAALIDHPPDGLEENRKVITVANTMTALNELAKQHGTEVQQRSSPLLGVLAKQVPRMRSAMP